MAAQSGETGGQAGGGGLLVGLSNDLAESVERAGRYVVRVSARRRQAASGIVWSAEGVVVTADHVVEREEGITIGLPQGGEVPARLVGRDPGSDLAMLRAEATGLAPAEVAEAGGARVGNLVLALGRPGEGGTRAALGIVSAWSGPWRTWRGGTLERLIQTDVTLYPGFSGGPLVDAAGRVLGLNSSILTRGIAAAVPADLVGLAVEALLAHGRIRRGYLGVTSQPVVIPAALAGKLGLTQGSGLLVVGVEPEGPAERGGLIVGDILVALADRPIRDAEDLQGQLGPDRVGMATPVRVLRGGEPRDLVVTVGERP